MTDTVALDLERSIRRSRLRLRALILLSRLGTAYPAQLGRYLGVDSHRLHWAMHGHVPQYSDALALIPLGLVEELASAHGRAYRITTRGRRHARRLDRLGRRSAMAHAEPEEMEKEG